MDRELLIEIGLEELPASWMPGLTRQLAQRLEARLKEFRIPPTAPVESFSTPRRLTVRVAGIAERQDDLDEMITGPPVSAAFDKDGQPTPAALGFAKKQGVPFEAITRAATPKGEYLAYQKHQRGRSAVDTLPDILTAVLRDLAFPKQMRWDARLDDGRGELLFGRPIRWLLFLYGGRVVPFTISRSSEASGPQVQDVESGALTYGHRFLATSGRAGRSIKVRSFDEYEAKLAEHFVVLDHAERRNRIARDLEAHARRLGGRVQLKEHAALLEEVADLVEYPSVVAGFFDAGFLVLPEEVLATTLVHHQHYFPVVTDGGGLKEAFLAIVNTQPTDERVIAKNAERVVAARLRDAKFFWESDRQHTLDSRLERLHTVVFHKKLGSYRDKAERIEALAKWIAAGALAQPNIAEPAAIAARLAKTDLTTDMVFEFPELQGKMGGIYARDEGQPERVWKAIYYHYLPTAVDVDAPPSRVQLGDAGSTWAAVSLADKLDSLVGLFHAGERPTGSRDPFGMRRAGHGIMKTLVDLDTLTGTLERPKLGVLLEKASDAFPNWDTASIIHLYAFMLERLQYVLEQRGFDVRNVRAVLHESSFEKRSPLEARKMLEVLPEFTETPEFRQLAVAFKRVKNIAKELDPLEYDRARFMEPPLQSILQEPAELALLNEIEQRAPIIEGVVAAGENYRRGFGEAAKFGPAVDRFFKEVFVMADQPALRRARLRLMRQLEGLILTLADISEIVPQTE